MSYYQVFHLFFILLTRDDTVTCYDTFIILLTHLTTFCSDAPFGDICTHKWQRQRSTCNLFLNTVILILLASSSFWSEKKTTGTEIWLLPSYGQMHLQELWPTKKPAFLLKYLILLKLKWVRIKKFLNEKKDPPLLAQNFIFSKNENKYLFPFSDPHSSYKFLYSP